MNDPSFRRRIQERMAGHIGQLVADVHEYFETLIKALKKRHGDDTRCVFMLDSIEHIRGTHVWYDVHPLVCEEVCAQGANPPTP